MILSWMLYAILVSALAGGAALLLELALRAAGRPVRGIWIAALAFAALWPLALLARRSAEAVPGQGSGVTLPPVLVSAGHQASHAVAAFVPTLGRGASAAILLAWLLLSAALLARLALGMRAIRQARRRWEPRAVDDMQVLIAPDTGPAVVGVRRPAIVLPSWALGLEPALRALVLRHEAEHLRAHDGLLRLAAALVTALFPWNPALWWQADRLALAIEVDCDARVLRAGGRRERYGLLLLAIAQRQSTTMLAPALSEPTPHLERRITAMHRSPLRRPLLAVLGLAAAGVVVLAVACSLPSPNTAVAPGTSQQPPSVTPDRATSMAANGQPFFEFQVTKTVALLPGNRFPHYPDSLRAQKVEGAVLMQFVVDTMGAVQTNTIKQLKSADPRFTAAVLEVLPSMRFSPAEANGRKVKQIVQMPFQFSLGK